MKKLLLLLALAGSSLLSSAQQHHCATDDVMKEAMQNDPSILLARAQLEQFTQQFAQGASIERRNNTIIYVIPVVFHVLHNYGPENISDAQIIDQIRVMNEDYQLRNSDTSLTIPIFKSIMADCQIEFRLATIDPNGNCTNGIDRIVTPFTVNAGEAQKLNPWPRNKYLNIWTAASLSRAGAAAYAYLPGGAPSAAVDGILSLANYIGSIGSSSINNSRTITHEVGHFLNLYHPWGPGNDVGTTCGDDLVNDTPTTKGWTTCNLQGSTCVSGVIENVQNHMDYSYCSTMFTLGQKTRMFAALNSNVGQRSSLWQASNLVATGTDGTPAAICSPVADFSALNTFICAGGSISFRDASWRAPVSSYSWSFPGGSPSSDTTANPTVTYANAGTYPVTLVVTSAGGTDSITKSQFVRVSGAATTNIPFSESFEDVSGFPGTDGYIVNEDNGITWARVTNTASDGTASIRINNYTNTSGAVDEFVTSSFDLSNVTNPVITFKVANAQRSSTSNDELRVYTSVSCGQQWTPRLAKTGATLSTAGIVTTSFTPSNASQWRTETLAINSLGLRPNVRIKFQNVSNRGNNTYIDQINITGTLVSVEEAEDITTGFAVYPNPSLGQSSVQFYLNSGHQVTLTVKDLLGKVVSNVFTENLSGGNYTYKLPQLTSGVYLIDLNIEGKHLVRRLIVSE